ncbi:ATP-binding protein [Pseudoalteromonas gelatinilytica]|uniref:histidine kinase n=1 Tax=Pseudoalteromonas gelatinilytica TaxID=1703256 RepID=A0ABQ1U932_9GAMM|nr:transporter substrate-binding domain-containing protein [Pseudoalteromonas profundi]GGF12655.1 histidine kinase [Pseudoalteromonas profundi]
MSKITVFTLIVLSLLVSFSTSAQPTSVTLKAGIVSYNFFPYHTRDADGQFSGVIVGYSNEIARLAEADLEYRVFDSLDELLDALKAGEIDFAVGLNKTAQRKKHFLFSTPFMEAPRGIVANQSIANDALKNLASLRWVCITGSSHCEYLVENGALFINRFIKPDDAFKKVADGTFDAFMGDYSVLSHQLKNRSQENLKVVSPIWLSSETLHVMFNKNKTALRNQVNSVLAAISPTTKQLWESSASEEYLAAKAYSQFKRDFNRIDKKEENNYLLTFSFVDGLYPIHATSNVGEASGYLNDTLELLAQRSGFQFKYIPAANSKELERLFLANKIDLIPTMTPTKIDEGVLIALPSHYSLEMVLISKRASNTKRIGYLEVFADPKQKLLTNELVETVSFDSIKTLFFALRNDNIDAVILPQSIAAYQLNQFYIGEFYINPKYRYTQPIYFLVNKHFSEFATLLDSLFKTLTSNDFSHVVNRHGIFSIERGYDRKTVNTTAILILILIAVSVIYFISWRLTINREIAKRKEAEEVALSKLNFTQKLIDDLPTMVVIQDQHQKRIMWNRAYKENFAHLWDENNQYLRGDIKVVKKLISQNEQSLSSGKVINQHINYINKAGKELELLYTKKPYVGLDGELAGIMTVLTDVTEHRHLQRENQSVQQLLQTITDTIPGGVFQYEYYDNGEGCYTYISKGAQSLLGITSRMINQRGMTGCISPYIVDEDRVHIAKSFKAASKLNKMIDIEFRINNLGQQIWCRFIANAEINKRDDRQGVRWNGILLDISLLKRQQADLSKATQLAHQADLAKSRFIATMSHELRTPMSGVNGFIELLKSSSLDEEQHFLVEHIDSSVTKLRTLVDDILYFANTSTGNIEVELREVDLEAHLCRVMRAHEYQAKQKGLEFNLIWRTAAYTLASVDISHLMQVLSNVLNNAVKFTEKGSISCDVLFDKQSLKIEISDTGKGMTAEQLAHTFTPFEQADNSIQRRHGGTGLGLSLAKQLVEAMQGEISLSSTYGKGTNVYIAVPLKNVSKQKLQAVSINWAVCSQDHQLLNNLASMGVKHHQLSWPIDKEAFSQADNILIDESYIKSLWGAHWQQSISAANNNYILVASAKKAHRPANCSCHILPIEPLYPDTLRELINSVHTSADEGITAQNTQIHGQILIAEDNKTNQLLLEKQCQKLGIKAVMVDDGIAALRALETGHFDLLLTDCHMPDLDGFKLTEQLRSQEKFKRLPIIGFTADDSKECLNKALKSGMNCVLFKPYKLNELYNRLVEFIDLKTDDLPNGNEGSDISLQGIKDKQHWLTIFGNENDAKMLADVFISSLQSDLNTLQEHLESQNSEKVSAAIHKLKGAIVMLQYPPLSELIVTTENTFNQQQDTLIVEKLITELSDVIDKIKLWL